MAISLTFGSIGFIARFIVAFIIITYLFSKSGKSDPNLKKGFTLLCIFGAVVVVLGIVAVSAFLTFGGISFLGDALSHIRYHY